MNGNSDGEGAPNTGEKIVIKNIEKFKKKRCFQSQSISISIKRESAILDPLYTEKLARAVEEYNQHTDSRRSSANITATPQPEFGGPKEKRNMSLADDVMTSNVNNENSASSLAVEAGAHKSDSHANDIVPGKAGFKSLDELEESHPNIVMQTLSVSQPGLSANPALIVVESTGCLVNISEEEVEKKTEARLVRSNSSIFLNIIKPSGLKFNTIARKVANFSEMGLGLRVSINEFNRNPIQGVAMLLLSKSVEPSATDIARFCKNNLYVSKEKVGELLGSISNKFFMDVLEEYGRLFDFKNTMIHEALRLFQTYFRMPGEAQKIQSVVEAFANRFFECNMNIPNAHDYTYKDVDTIVVLSYAIIMLNVDQHNPQVKMKMTAFEFSDNIIHAPGCEDIPSTMLDTIFENIRDHEFKVGSDHLNQLYQLEALYPMKNIKIINPGRHFIGIYIVNEVIPDSWNKVQLKSRNLLLFNDIIICIRDTSTPNNTFLRKNNRSNLYKASYELKNYNLKIANDHKITKTFSLIKKNTNEAVVAFRCATEETFHKLINLINLFIEDIKWGERIKKALSKSALKTIVEFASQPDLFDDKLEAFGLNSFGGNYNDLLNN